MKSEIIFLKSEPEAETCVKTEPQELSIKIGSGTIMVKEEPLCEDSASASSSQVDAWINYATNVKEEVKDEPLCMDSLSTSTSQDNTVWTPYILDIKKEPEYDEHVTEPNEDMVALSVNDPTTWGDLYMKRQVKEELDLSPESIHRPQASVLTETTKTWTALESGCPTRPESVLVDTGAPSTSSDCQYELGGESFSNKTPFKKDTCVIMPESLTKGELCGYPANPELLKIEHSYQNYMCPDCDYTTVVKKSLQTHIKSHKGKKLFICNHCSYSTSNETYLKRHQIIHSEKRFKCSCCDFSCHRKADLQNHEMIHTGQKPYKCSDCDYQCIRKGDLQTHERTHTGDKPFQCPECDNKFPRKDSLQRHQITHASEKPFRCNLCDFKTYQKTSLRIHGRIHTGEKRFECTHCDLKFRHEFTLRTHVMIHTGKKPFQCDICNYKCIRKSDMQKHQSRHSDNKPFKCNDCHYSCRQKSDLRKHTHTHGEKLFGCSYCDYKGRRKDDLKRHQKVHSGPPKLLNTT